MQYVDVVFNQGNGKTYLYEWEDSFRPSIKEGDRVVVPGNWANAEPQIATAQSVSNVRSTKGYQGALSRLVGVYDSNGQLFEG